MRFHYYMIAGNVVIDNGNDSVTALPANGMIQVDTRNLGLHQIAKMQESLQVSVATKMGEVPKIVDVVIISCSYLGHMSKEEFEKRPKNTDVKIRAPLAADAIDFTGELQDRG